MVFSFFGMVFGVCILVTGAGVTGGMVTLFGGVLCMGVIGFGLGIGGFG